jgi:hypothetical protein
VNDSWSRRAGETIRDHDAPEPDRAAYVEARGRFVDAALAVGPARARRRRHAAFAVAVAAVMVSAVALVFHLRELQRPLGFSTGAARATGVVAEYMVPPAGEDLSVYFSDGSVVTLDPTARARVDRTTSHGASVLVESGTIEANVVHRTDSEWAFVAGPYSVRVTGTAFELSWDPAGYLDIRMKAGSVEVRGPDAMPPIRVTGSRRFTSGASVSADAVASARNEGQLPRSDGTEPLTVAGASSAPRAREALRPEPIGSRPAQEGETRPERWSALVARGEYERVLDLAEKTGVDGVLSSANVDDLAALADAARFTRHGSLAERTLDRLRARFSGTGSAKAAAFLLGRMADDAGNTSTAISWYETYLREAPGGPLASEALGRRMLALRNQKNVESTRSAAKEYLERFTTGSYAPIAHEILEH